LPSGLLDFFEIVSLDTGENGIDIHLEELNQIPDEYKKERLRSEGFHSSIKIQDFPLRHKPIYLHLRRRRWLIESTSQVVSRNLEMVEKEIN
jgi:hypothetical protein